MKIQPAYEHFAGDEKFEKLCEEIPPGMLTKIFKEINSTQWRMPTFRQVWDRYLLNKES